MQRSKDLIESAKQFAINLVSANCKWGGVANTVHANPGMHSAYNVLTAPQKYAQTAFVVVLPPTTIKSARGIFSEDSENRQ